MHNVMALPAEAELGAHFYNAKEANMLQTTLEEMGHPQLATPIETNDTCAAGMRFYWVKDRVNQGQFLIYWRKGSENDAGYFTKHHLPANPPLADALLLLPQR
jgi:hypothetical protein